MIARRYAREITNSRVQCPQDFGEHNVAHLFVVRSEDRDGLRRHLGAHGVDTDIHYPIPDHQQTGYPTATSPLDLTETEKLARQIVTLPCFTGLEDDEISQVIEAVNRW